MESETDAVPQKTITLASLPAIKKEVTRISKHNKMVKKQKIMMHPSTPAERDLAEAWADNEREGPGLRSGPRRKVYNRSNWGDEDNNSQSRSLIFPTIGYIWLTIQGPDPNPEQAGLGDVSVPASPWLSDSSSNGQSLSTPSSILEKPESDTPAEHHYHARQALALASSGGLVAAYSKAESAPEGEPTDDEKKIGRSLFIALDVVTSETDESVVLEIGWAAMWWQSVNADDPKGDFELTRDQGHFL